MKPNSFQKEERLCNQRLIRSLFHTGSSFHLYPFRITFLPVQDLDVPAQIILSVPKKRFKRAVDRNQIKRRMREAYRLNKCAHLYGFLTSHSVALLLSIQYIGKEIHDFHFIEEKLIAALIQLKQVYGNIHLGENN